MKNFTYRFDMCWSSGSAHLSPPFASPMNFRSICFPLWLLLTTALASILQLELNPQSPLFSAFQSIHHDIHACQIIVNLQPSRKCQKPTLRIRISGTSLLIMKLDESTSTAEADKLVYTYPQVVDEGVYFVEVLVLFCNLFDPENFQNTCLESVEGGSNIVTLPYSFHVAANETVGKRPRWVLSDKHNSTMLTTRYQKPICLFQWNISNCESPADIVQYDLYDWTDRPNYLPLVAEVLKVSRAEEKNNGTITAGHANIRMCLVGDSHAHTLSTHGKLLELKHVEFVFVASHFPHGFQSDWFVSHQCSYAVVTYGQWPASERMKGHPYPQSKFQEEMRRVVSLLQKYDPKLTQVFLRSINYNGLGARHTACRPIDYRSPPVIDMYNTVIRNLAKELNVSYIDLTHIIGPKWDAALDWSHPVGKVATAEIEWIVFKALQYSLQHKMGVVLHAPNSPENSLIRFADSKMVYLYQDGSYHAFPNGRMFLEMGYDFDNVKTVPANRRAELPIGAELSPL